MAVKKMGKAILFFHIIDDHFVFSGSFFTDAYFGWYIEGREDKFYYVKYKFSDWSEMFPQLKLLLSDVELSKKEVIDQIRESPREYRNDLDKFTNEALMNREKIFPRSYEISKFNPFTEERESLEEYCKKKEKEYRDKYHDVITELFYKLRQDSFNKPILLRWKGSDLVYAYCKDSIYKFDRTGYSDEEMILQIMNLEDAERRKFERLKHQFNEAEKIEKEGHRPAIPEEARIAVWRRDEGKCVKCGSRENLEYDHIVPISKGGSNTVRNIELLCQKCNREKKDNIC